MTTPKPPGEEKPSEMARKAAAACWRAGTDEQGGQARMERIIYREVVAPLEARIEELEQDLTGERLARANTTNAVLYEYERAQTAEQRLSEVEAALRPFAEPHSMGDNYVQFAPHLIEAARKALRGSRP